MTHTSPSDSHYLIRHVRVIWAFSLVWPLIMLIILGWIYYVHYQVQISLAHSWFHYTEYVIIGVIWVIGQCGLWCIRCYTLSAIQHRDTLIRTLQSRRHDLEVIFNTAPVIMIVVDADRRVRRANQVALNATATTEDQIVGLRGGEALRCLNAGEDPRGCGFSAACAHCQVRQAVAQTFRTQQNIYKRSAQLPLPVGKRDLLISTSLLTDMDEPLTLVVIDDETERKQAATALHMSNQQLAQALTDLAAAQQRLADHEQLAALGRITAGVAHDFNNIMTCIRGSAELIQTDPITPLAIQADIETIIRSSERASNIVRQLLDFSRNTMRHHNQIDLVQVVRETQPLLVSSIQSVIEVHWEIEPGMYRVHGNSTQIQQVLINLVLNARDAMPEGGTLTIGLTSYRLVEAATADIRDHFPSGSWACLSVTDTGVGIDPALIQRIFEPFFTTKEVGSGTGLGLAQVYGIVRQHAGHIIVTSQLGAGTCFAIYLPPLDDDRSLEEVASLPVVLAPRVEPQRLLFEDTPQLQATIGAMLAQLGYHTQSSVADVEVYQHN